MNNLKPHVGSVTFSPHYEPINNSNNNGLPNSVRPPNENNNQFCSSSFQDDCKQQPSQTQNSTIFQFLNTDHFDKANRNNHKSFSPLSSNSLPLNTLEDPKIKQARQKPAHLLCPLKLLAYLQQENLNTHDELEYLKGTPFYEGEYARVVAGQKILSFIEHCFSNVLQALSKQHLLLGRVANPLEIVSSTNGRACRVYKIIFNYSRNNINAHLLCALKLELPISEKYLPKYSFENCQQIEQNPLESFNPIQDSLPDLELRRRSAIAIINYLITNRLTGASFIVDSTLLIREPPSEASWSEWNNIHLLHISNIENANNGKKINQTCKKCNERLGFFKNFKSAYLKNFEKERQSYLDTVLAHYLPATNNLRNKVSTDFYPQGCAERTRSYLVQWLLAHPNVMPLYKIFFYNEKNKEINSDLPPTDILGFSPGSYIAGTLGPYFTGITLQRWMKEQENLIQSSTNNLVKLERIQNLINNITHITHELLKAVAHLQAQNVVHRDLHPGNILITPTDGLPKLVLIDFELAAKITGLNDNLVCNSSSEKINRVIAPSEDYFGEDYTWCRDSFSVGLLILSLFSPFIELSDKERNVFLTLQKKFQHWGHAIGINPPKGSDLMKPLIFSLLLNDQYYTERWSCIKALNYFQLLHPQYRSRPVDQIYRSFNSCSGVLLNEQEKNALKQHILTQQQGEAAINDLNGLDQTPLMTREEWRGWEQAMLAADRSKPNPSWNNPFVYPTDTVGNKDSNRFSFEEHKGAP